MSLNILPNELIENIAINLKYIDLCKLSQVNSRFNSYLTNFNELWHRSFRKQWPSLYVESFEPVMENGSEINWRSETIQCHMIGVNVYNELYRMSAIYYQKDELSDKCFDIFRRIATGKRQHCVIDELEAIVNSDNKKKNNLTIKYYAQKALRSLRTDVVRNKWTRMIQELNYSEIGEASPVNIQQPNKNDIPGDLITGSVLFAQFCQPNTTISEEKIRQQIRKIASKAVDILRVSNPKHSFITHRNGKLLTNLEASNLTESVFEPKDCIEIIQALNVALYGETCRFCGNSENYYLPTNSYIDKVLELRLGIPITLCILYQATAALLGVKLFSISNPGHFMLAIRDKPQVQEFYRQFTYIDPFHDGKLSDPQVNSNPRFDPNVRVTPCRPLAVFLRMAANLVEIGRRKSLMNILRNGVELATMIWDRDTQMQFLLAQVYLTLNINHERIMDISQQLDRDLGVRHLFVQEVNKKMEAVVPPTVVKHRTNVPEVDFAVGMVMRYNKSSEFICVVCGWAVKCAEWSEWKAQLVDAHLPKDENEPLYRVLLADGTICYTVQEFLSIERNVRETFHTEVGRYFTSFNGRNFELNDETRAAYPDDESVLDGIYFMNV